MHVERAATPPPHNEREHGCGRQRIRQVDRREAADFGVQHLRDEDAGDEADHAANDDQPHARARDQAKDARFGCAERASDRDLLRPALDGIRDERPRRHQRQSQLEHAGDGGDALRRPDRRPGLIEELTQRLPRTDDGARIDGPQRAIERGQAVCPPVLRLPRTFAVAQAPTKSPGTLVNDRKSANDDEPYRPPSPFEV